MRVVSIIAFMRSNSREYYRSAALQNLLSRSAPVFSEMSSRMSTKRR